MSELTKIELTSEEVEDFKQFRLYQQQFMNVSANWKKVHDFAATMQFGTFSLIIKDGIPTQINNPLQTLLLIKI